MTQLMPPPDASPDGQLMAHFLTCPRVGNGRPTLERKFETTSDGAHKDYKLMLSAEPPALSLHAHTRHSLQLEELQTQ